MVFWFLAKSFVVARFSPPSEPDLSLPRLPRTVPAQGKTPEEENFAFDCALPPLALSCHTTDFLSSPTVF